jgi:hypothetical protein
MLTKERLGFAWAGTLASFVAPLVVVLWQAANSLIDEHGVDVSIGPIFLLGLPISILSTWFLGLPLVLYLRWKQVLNAKIVCAGGAAFGASFLIVFFWIIDPPLLPWPRLLGQGSAGAFLGFAVAVVFCVLARIPLRSHIRGSAG